MDDQQAERDPMQGLEHEITALATPAPGSDETERKTAEEQEKMVEGALGAEITQCEAFIDTDISQDRAKATRYYRGDYFGDEEEGRSSIVMPVVRDVIRASLPGLMKTFFGGQNVVEFSAVGDAPSTQDVQDASDATATINHLLINKNEGWSLMWGVFKDALRGRTGWCTWWYDKSPEVTACTYTRVSEEQLQALTAMQDDREDIQVISKSHVYTNQIPGPDATVTHPETGADMMHPETGEPIQVPHPDMGTEAPLFEYTVRVITRKPRNKLCVDSVPPEEIIYSRESASIDGHRAPRLIGRRRVVTKSYCIGLGISEDFLEANTSLGTRLSLNVERTTRNPQSQGFSFELDTGTDDQMAVMLYDLYYRVDQDQDGISELRHIIALGDNKKIWSNEYAKSIPLALFCPDPEPHLMVGLGQSDSTMDLQLIQSHVWRDVLDSLKLSIFPRTAYVEGQVNVDDVLNTEIGSAIRMRQPGMVQAFAHEFSGQKAFPLLEMLDSVQERRTGIGQATMGMDGSALQSTTAQAAQQTITASQQMIELTARIFAETGMKRLFMGMLELLRDNQDQDMQFRLNGRNYKVSPQKWGEFDISIDTGLGIGSQAVALGALQAHAVDLQQSFGSMGMNNPLGSLQELYETKKRIFEIAGVRNIQKYMRDPSLAEQNGAQVQSPTSPEQTVADAEVAIKGRMEDRETLDIILTDDREREKQIAHEFLEAAKIQGQWNIPVDLATMKLLQEREKAEAGKILLAQKMTPPPGAPAA